MARDAMWTDTYEQSQVGQTILVRRIVAVAVTDVAIVIAFLWFTDSESDPGIPFIEIAIGTGILWAATLAFRIKGWLGQTIARFAIPSDALQRLFLTILRSPRIEWPSFLDRRFQSLRDIAEDEDQEPAFRVRAASIHSYWTGYCASRGAAETVSVMNAWDAAIRTLALEQARSRRKSQSHNKNRDGSDADA